MADLKGKRILITGAAKRIGRSMALAVAHAGGDVVIHYGGSQTEALSLQAEIRSLGCQADLVQADLNNPQEVEQIIPQALESGPLFGLINNASLFAPLNWEKTTLEEWNRHMMINLAAPFLLSQAYAKALLPEAEGRIINMLDWRSFRPGADHFPYTISKAALAALTQGLAVSLAPRVKVNGLALGAILPPTDFGDPSKTVASTPVPRWAELDEVDETILFLLSGPAYITGEIIYLDGGRHLV